MPSKSVLIAQAFSKTGVLSTVVDSAPSVNTGQVDVATSADLPNTGNTQGDFAFVQATNRLYLWSGSGWYSIALINTSPEWDSNGQPASSYALSADDPQTATTITLAASDPEGVPISYEYITSGQMDSIATISQDSSVFTITPKNETQAPDGGVGSITFRATDGVNILPATSQFTLSFISIIENSRYTTLLATATGTSDNNNITDASSNNHSITVTGDAHAGTFSPYRHGGYSAYWGGQMNIASAITPIGTSNFTIEAWINFSSISGSPWILDGRYDASNNGYGNGGIGLRLNSSGQLWANTSQTTTVTGTTVLSTNTWHHIMVVRSGTGTNEFKVYLNGNLEVQGTDANSKTCAYIRVGSSYIGGNNPSGYIRDLRISTTARSTTTPTEPVEADSDTIWLGCSLPYFADASSSNNSLTITGDLETRPFGPYDYNKYDAANNGGSIHFPSGTGTRLSSASSSLELGTGNFTIEGWVYNTVATPANYIIDYRDPSNAGSNRLVVQLENGAIQYLSNNSVRITSGSVKSNTWYHWALCRSGTNTKMFLNGKQTGSTFTSDNIDLEGQQPYIGAHNNVPNVLPFKGYISDFKITKSDLYTADFTPPTAPLASTNSVLHMKGTDASIIDKSQGSNLKLVGNTTGSTTQAKFANTKSMYFDGSGDSIITPTDVNLIAKEAYTWEAWCYFETVTGWRVIFGTEQVTERMAVELRNSKLGLNAGGNILQSGSTVMSTGQWYHLAISRQYGTSDATTRFFVNGQLDQTQSSWQQNTAIIPQNFYIGAPNSTDAGNGAGSMHGYMQDVKFTSGLTKYTANFTPPSEPLEG